VNEQDWGSRSHDLHANADARRLEVDELRGWLQAVMIPERCFGMAITLDPSVSRVLGNCRAWRHASYPVRRCGLQMAPFARATDYPPFSKDAYRRRPFRAAMAAGHRPEPVFGRNHASAEHLSEGDWKHSAHWIFAVEDLGHCLRSLTANACSAGDCDSRHPSERHDRQTIPECRAAQAENLNGETGDDGWDAER
jgi:hypothetical protein